MADHITRTEYGIRWDSGETTGPDPEPEARRVAAQYDDATLVARTVLVGPWEDAPDVEPDPEPARPVSDLARVELVDPAAWAPWGEADVRPCIIAGVHRRAQRHPRAVCPHHAPGRAL